MTLKSASLFIVALLFALIFPVLPVASQSAGEDGVQIISLSESGHDIANAVLFSHDGKRIVVGTSSGISIFDSKSLFRERFIETGTWVRSITLSSDEQTLAAGLFDNTVRLWNFSDGREISVLRGHTNWVRSVAFSPNGRLLATAGDDDTVLLWDTSTHSIKRVITQVIGARVLAFSPDGQELAIGLQDSTIKLIKASDGSLTKTLVGHTDWVRSLVFSPDGATLASGAFDATIILWDVSNGHSTHKLTGHQSSVLSLAFSPDGMTLASGSVDSTVKLWDPKDGNLLHTLIGHTDFVYSVGFSPDGKILASGSSDNTVRLWNLTQPSLVTTPLTNTPSDCRSCHHPRGLIAPPRVIQVKCNACHADGIGLNFCPTFPSAQIGALPVQFRNSDLPTGVPVAGENLAVIINYPTNGESLYSSSAYRAPLYVTGSIKSDIAPTHVTLELSVFSRDATEPVFTVTGHPSETGSFEYKLTQNHDKPLPIDVGPATQDCLICHGTFQNQSNGDLPEGEVRLLVRATTPDGRTATDERWLYVDTSKKVMIEVNVVDKDTRQPIAGLPVQASTILYHWRERYAHEKTNLQGVAYLNVEVLTQAPTVYQFTMPDTVLDGSYYSAFQPISISILPDETLLPAVTIEVQSRVSHVFGHLTGTLPAELLDVLAIRLPDGDFHRIRSSGDYFEFHGLANGKYLFTPDPLTLLSFGLYSQPAAVDLSVAPEAHPELVIMPKTGIRISGRLLDRTNTANIPFAWIVAKSGQVYTPDPVTGEFTFFTDGSTRQSLTVLAPGYYSQTQMVELTSRAVDGLIFSLVRQSTTKSLNWGEGKIIIPSDSVYEFVQNTLKITRGWVWGYDGNSAQTIEVAGKQLELTNGTFALEYLPPEGGWLYVLTGQGVIQAEGLPDIQVKSGEMVFLQSGVNAQPVLLEPSVLAILKNVDQPPISPTWEPGLGTQITNRLAQFGIGFMQIITFITYLIVLVFLVIIIYRTIYWLIKERKNSRSNRRSNVQ
ncbi:MAG: WD40 repeat domain-containing protein [Chloroflexi bacterium]|nr:WD40 repeat domain-containing protein [Chloroflexota bacterium]NOG76188.1 WD40 repeat domain-containing protein [Chloroflexota bacterium]